MESESRERDGQPQPAEWPAGGGEMGARIRAHAWSATPLGSIETWPPSLRTAVDLMLASGFAAALAWGPEGLTLYNDAYGRIIGPRHPAALGQSTYTTFPESRAAFAPVLARVWQGETVTLKDQPYPLLRAGGVEDAWFTLTYSPLRAETGAIVGVYALMIETTGRVRAEAAARASEERQAFLLTLSDALRAERDPDAVGLLATRLLAAHMGVDRCWISRLSHDQGLAWLGPEYHAPDVAPVSGEYRFADFPESMRQVETESLVIRDVWNDASLPERDKRSLDAMGLHAVLAAILRKGERNIVWALAVGSAGPRAWTDEDLRLVAETAERTWAALERGRAEAALRASEARFRSFADSSADTLWIVDAATQRMEYLSPAFERTWGAPREVIMRDLGRWAALVHPGDREQASRLMPRALAGEAVVGEYRIVRPTDGAVRWIQDTGFPIRDEQGRVTRVAGIAQDITDQKEAAAALREAHDTLERRVQERTAGLAAAIENLRASQTRLHLLIEQMPAVLWTTDRDLRVTTLAGAAVPALPVPLRAAVGEAVPNLFAPLEPGDADAAPVTAHRQALTGASVGFDVEVEGRIYDAHVEPLRDAAGQIVGVIGVAHDITDRTLLRLQDEFLALASHELRTPLTPAMVYLQMAPRALTAGDAERAAHYLALAMEQVQRLNALVSDLLDVGRLRNGRLDLARTDVDLKAVVRRACETAQLEAGAQGQTIILHASNAPLVVAGDAGRLEQVSLNLLANAIKHAPRSTTIDVRLRADTEARSAVLVVEDDGPGIPTADLPHLFSRFYQVERPDRPSRSGLGLGLYLVRELVEAHGGTVAVASIVDHGTTFTVRLPLPALDTIGIQGVTESKRNG